MLPRRIQFLKRSMDPTAKMVRPLITLDFRNLVINEPVDDQAFVFKTPEKAVEVDETENVIQMIQQSLKPASTEPAAPDAAGTPATPPATATPAEPGK
jgi:outer membrane lipoprotein-sorting protein